MTSRRNACACAANFAALFFARNPALQQFAPTLVEKCVDSGPEARQVGDEIHIYPKFWRLDEATQDFVFAHEVGHYAVSRYGLSRLIKYADELGIDMWDTTSLPFGQYNMEEAVADAFAVYQVNRSELQRRYPKWVKLIDGLLKSWK